MKKIGILTYIREYANLGTNMQAYSTFKAIQNQYPDDRVEIIDYSGWKPAMKPYLTQVSIRSLINDFIRIWKFRKFFKNEFIFSRNKLISANLTQSIEFIRNQNYDIIYVGSDTCLELKRAEKDSLTAYWLDESVQCIKFLISASSHNVVFENLSSEQKNKMQNTIDGYSLLGVRDEASYRLLSHFKRVEDDRLKILPDPTFTYNIDYSFIESYLKRKKVALDKPIVCLHLTRSTKWANELASYFRKEGFLIASLRPAYYADMIFTDLSAFEQMGLYRYFKLVITHRFHDSIFCIKNLTPVIVYPEFPSDITIYDENKNRTLFKSFNIEDNYIGNSDMLNAKSIFNFHRKAISNFNNNEAHIKDVLIENRRKYELFISLSKEISYNV